MLREIRHLASAGSASLEGRSWSCRFIDQQEICPNTDLEKSRKASPCAAAWPALPARAECVLQLPLGWWEVTFLGVSVVFPECDVPAAEAKGSGDFEGQPAALDTQLLQSSASLDSSSVLPSTSTSFEPIKPDPTGGEYAACFMCCPKILLLGVRERLLGLEEGAELHSAFAVSQSLQRMSRHCPVRLPGNMVTR